jgi:hypothetical protein
MAIQAVRGGCRAGLAAAIVAGLLAPLGCYNTPIDTSDYTRGPAPLRMPSPARAGEDCCYEDGLTGGHIFEMYCAACHNARSLAERPFASYQNAAAHMRVRANLSGKEYAELMAWLRRWHDVPPVGQREGESPKRFFFSQPISELRKEQPKTAPDLVAGPRLGAASEVDPGQPPPGSSPREAR